MCFYFQLPTEKPENLEKTISNLKSISINELSIQSQKLISLPPDEQAEFISKYADQELQRLPTIVTMTSIRRTASTSSLVSCLIIASENGEIIILDSQTFTVLHHVSTI